MDHYELLHEFLFLSFFFYDAFQRNDNHTTLRWMKMKKTYRKFHVLTNIKDLHVFEKNSIHCWKTKSSTSFFFEITCPNTLGRFEWRSIINCWNSEKETNFGDLQRMLRDFKTLYIREACEKHFFFLIFFFRKSEKEMQIFYRILLHYRNFQWKTKWRTVKLNSHIYFLVALWNKPL